MKINKTLRKELITLLPSNYRKTIVDRLAVKGITVHPNTVSNTLNGGTNDIIALELMKLAKEEKDRLEKEHREFNKIREQLSAA